MCITCLRGLKNKRRHMTKFRLRTEITALATLAVVAICATTVPRIAVAAPVLLTNGGAI